jgi:hypothetical protein
MGKIMTVENGKIDNQFDGYEERHDELDFSEKIDTLDGMVVIAPVAQVGVVERWDSKKNKMIREFISPETLFDQKSIESMYMKPVLADHVYSKDLKSTKAVLVGSVGESHDIVDNKMLRYKFTISGYDGDKEVKLKGKNKLSCGYMCKTIDEQGTFEGKQYDVRQVERINTHLALCTNPRGGSGLSFKADSNDDNNKGEIPMASLKIDKKIYEVTEEVFDAYQNAQDTISKLTEANKKLTIESAEFNAKFTSSEKNYKELLDSIPKKQKEYASVLEFAKKSGITEKLDSINSITDCKAKILELHKIQIPEDKKGSVEYLDSYFSIFEQTWSSNVTNQQLDNKNIDSKEKFDSKDSFDFDKMLSDSVSKRNKELYK